VTRAGSIFARARGEGGQPAGPLRSRRVFVNTGDRSPDDDPAAVTAATAPAPEELDEASVLLDAPPPRNVAILTVQEHDKRLFSLQGMSGIDGMDGFGPTGPRNQPDIRLADRAQGEKQKSKVEPKNLIGIMNGFSEENDELRSWINKRRTAAGGDLHLVITDFTGCEIPWELLTLPSRGGAPETYLGATVSITRWHDLGYAHTFRGRLPLFTDEELTGHVAAFVDKTLKGGATEKTEKGVLTDLHATLDERLEQLRNRLGRPEAGFALVYLACHGDAEPPSPFDYALEARDGSGDRLTVGDLKGRTLQLFVQSRAIVFINACHSGRMLQDEIYLKSKYLRGFPDVFLRKGAVGVIGTTGFVNSEFAAKMGAWFLQELRTTGELEPVSELLRRWRAKVLSELPAERSEQDNAYLLNAFMYVYYGNPLARLRITEGEGPS